MANKVENLVFILFLVLAVIAGRERSPLLVGMLVFIYLGLLSICCLILIRKKRLQEDREKEPTLDELMISDRKKGYHDLKLFSFASIMAATDDFSIENKLGQGGFGLVYKGKLPDGKEMAVKRLLRSSGQGLQEFKNALVLIAKVQHLNLIRLLGYCVNGDEKMLVYEYMPNKSLDFHLFDPTRRKLLDWKMRSKIIKGIAQGLLYLHKYSRVRIIHRDLKPGNILLDDEMNPKISDFSMARVFGQNEAQATTVRVVGTYGYMAPEYIMKGNFSEKSDVYSFGVLLLEIVSGHKIIHSFCSEECPMSLSDRAWDLWKEGRSTELIDPALADHCTRPEIARCIHVCLLCLQENTVDRPTMSEVVPMISNENLLPLPDPKMPAFILSRHKLKEANSSPRKRECYSLNEASISDMEPR